MTQTWREKQKVEIQNIMKEQIEDAAFQLILEKGITNVTIVDIAKKVGTSRVTLYKYFNSIHEIAYDIQIKILSKMNSVNLIPENREDTSADMVRKVLMNYFEFFKNQPEEVRFTAIFDHAYHSAIPSPELQKKYEQFIRSSRANNKFEKLLTAGIEEGIFREDINPKLLSSTFTHSTLGLIQRLATRRNIMSDQPNENDIAILESFLTTLMNSVLKN